MTRFTSLLLVALLSACAGTEFHPARGATAYPAHPGEVEVLERFPEAGSYDSVGVVIAYGVNITEKKDLIEALQTEAAKRGANAILLQGDVKMRSRGTSREKVLGAYALRIRP